MRLFYPQVIPVNPQTLTLGGSITFPIPRESLISGLQLVLEGNVGTASGGTVPEGLASLVKSITVRGSLGGGATVEVCNGVSGGDLFDANQFQQGSLPGTYGNVTSTGRFRLNLFVWFREFFLSSELKNLMTALPAYAMSDLNLTIQIASAADIGGGLLVLSGTPQAFVNVHQYYRDSVPEGLPFIRSLYEVIEDTNIATSTNREVKLPSGGSYAYCLLRSFSSATAKQAPTGTAPITANPTPGGSGVALYDLSRFVKIQSDFDSIRGTNLFSVMDTLVDGNAALLFNRGESNLFQTGQLGRALNNVLLTYNATAAANSKVRFVTRRILDDANAYQVAM